MRGIPCGRAFNSAGTSLRELPAPLRMMESFVCSMAPGLLGEAARKDRRDLRDLLFIQGHSTAQFFQGRVERCRLFVRQWRQHLPLAGERDALVRVGIFAKLLGRLRGSSVLVSDIFVEVTTQEGVQRWKA